MAGLDFDLVVIGAGIAGMSSAVTAAGLGKRVAIVERRRFGGNCSSLTCLPSKTLVRAGHVRSLLGRLDQFGLTRMPSFEAGASELMDHVRSVVRGVTEKDDPTTFESLGIEAINGNAKFIDNHHVSVDGMIVSSATFIVATGTRPFIPSIPGLDTVDYLTNETLFDLNRLPSSMIILGGGVDGLEFASALRRLGVDITVVEMSARLLANEDTELADMLLQQLRSEGLMLLTGTKASGLSKDGNGVLLSATDSAGSTLRLKADSVLLTIGRKANIEDIGLEEAGVKYTPRGIVSNTAMQTSVRNIYACGDVAGPYQLASMAEYQGIIAGTNAILPWKRQANYDNAAFAIFTEPNLARVGLTEREAHESHDGDIYVYRFGYGQMRRAMVDGNTVGMAKIICDRRWHILGAHMLGESSAELVHEVQMARGLGLPLYKLSSVSRAYPTYSQAIVGRASQLAYLDRMAGDFFVTRFLHTVPGYHNRLKLARDRLAETGTSFPRMGRSLADGIKVKSARIATNTVVCEMPANLDNSDEGPYLDASGQSTPDQAPFVLLDFRRMQQMNGLGVSMMVKLANSAASRKQRLLAIGLSDHHRRVFDLTGLSRVVTVCSDISEASKIAGAIADGVLPISNSASPIDSNFWAKHTGGLAVPNMPRDAIKMNLRGRKVVGPVNGFGSLWEKKYQLTIARPDITPEEVLNVLKENFPKFQPKYNRFYPTAEGMSPGAIIAIDSSTPGGPVSTGVMVLYADNNSFTFITPQGHPESGWVTFSAFRDCDAVVAQILGLARANDPVYELAFRAVGSGMQIRIWRHVLKSLAVHLGVPAEVTVETACVGRRLQWHQAGNVWHNAQIRTILALPSWWLAQRLSGSNKSST